MKQRHHLVGEVGEELASRFLMKRGYKIIGRNYRKKWGEIDVIAKKGDCIHFVEVKTVSREINTDKMPVTHETKVENDEFRPEENVHASKIKRLHRAIQTYLIDNHVTHETPWQLDVVTVLLDLKSKRAEIDSIENIIL